MATATYTPLANLTLSSTVTTVTFSGISQAYKDLILITNVVGNSGAQNIVLINNDSGSNYNTVYISGDNSAVQSNYESNATRIMGWGAAGAVPTNLITHFQDYSATDKHKTIVRRFTRSDTFSTYLLGRWASNSAITSFTLGPAGSWTAGSTFALYGVSA
jgi:hypothetical protein